MSMPSSSVTDDDDAGLDRAPLEDGGSDRRPLDGVSVTGRKSTAEQ